ncbi:hypothetical protein ACFE04_010234 [Oxalis oulophora]
MASFGALKKSIFDREEKKQQYQAHIRGLNAYDRHKKFLKDYVSFYGKQEPSDLKLPIKTDYDTLREGYRFIRSEEDDLDTSWEQRLVGLRWRTEKEVISGKGQFICGNKHCDEKEGLASYEVNFAYFEAGENKQALVKLVTCKRNSPRSDDSDGEYERSKERKRKGKKVSSSDSDDKRRNVDDSSDNSYDEYEHSKDKKRKGKTVESSDVNHTKHDDENFDEFLEGMFP